MSSIPRRDFLQATVCGAAAATAALQGLAPHVAVSDTPGAKIRVGQIGVGHAHASGKMHTLRKLADQFEVVGVVEPDPKLRAQWEGNPVYRGLTWMTEEQLLNAKGLRAVAVETQVRHLVPTAARCVAAGMHIHLDKPGGESLRAFRNLLETASQRGLTVQMGYMFRNNPAFQFCFRAVREGWLGRVFELHAVMSKRADAAERSRLVPYPGGVMFELGCHLIDALVTVLGKPEKVTPFNRHSQPIDDGLADNQLAVFEYPRATATIRTAIMEVDGGRRRQFVVCGDEGTVDIRPLEPPRMLLALARVRERFTKGYQEVKLPAMPGRYDDQLLELARILHGEMQHPYAPAHDLAVQEAVLRASGVALEPSPQGKSG